MLNLHTCSHFEVYVCLFGCIIRFLREGTISLIPFILLQLRIIFHIIDAVSRYHINTCDEPSHACYFCGLPFVYLFCFYNDLSNIFERRTNADKYIHSYQIA